MQRRWLPAVLAFCVAAALGCGNDELTPQTGEMDAEAQDSGQDADRDSTVAESNVPDITGIELVSASADGDGDLTLIDTLHDGDQINLAHLDGLINVQAVSESADETGSVHFLLEGPTSLDRVEVNAPYTLATSPDHWDPAAGEPAVGDYTLTVTPYELADANGEAGRAVRVSFSVIDDASQLDLRAHDDAYTAVAGETLEVDAASGLLANDELAGAQDAEATVAVAPSRGMLTLETDGAFTYTPDADEMSGTDTFRYTLSGGGSSDQATVTLTLSSGEATGFTAIDASSDTRVIYVSSSTGDDGNDGLSPAQAVATLDEATGLMREGYPDHVLLKRGDEWTGQNLSGVKSGRSASEPAVVGFYGSSGPRPKIRNDDLIFNNNGGNPTRNVHFIGLHLVAYKLDPDDPAFNGTDSANFRMIGGQENLLFEDIKFQHVELIVQDDGQGGVPKNITLRRNIFTEKYYNQSSYNRDSRPSFMYVEETEGFVLEQNVFDYGGWSPRVDGAGGNMFNHNIYLQTDNTGNGVVVRENIIVRGSSHGVHGRAGGLFENNFFARNAVALGLGYHGGPALESGTIAHAFDNVIMEGVNMERGHDACNNSSLCTGAIWGIDPREVGQGDVRAERNVIANRDFSDSGYARAITMPDDIQTQDNILYRWDAEDQGTDQTYPDPERSLATYNASLGGAESFDEFMETAKDRPLQTWDARYGADAINDYIRAGFGR